MSMFFALLYVQLKATKSLEAGHKALYKCELCKEEQLTGKFSTSKSWAGRLPASLPRASGLATLTT